MSVKVKNRVYAASHVLDALRSDKGVIDFNSIIPMPEQMLVSARMKTEHAAEDLYERGMLTRENIRNGDIARAIAQLQDLDHADRAAVQQMLENKIRTGFFRWHDWCDVRWRTGGNALDAIREDGFVEFTTYWRSPEPILEALSARFPGEEIVLEYADDMHQESGAKHYRGGQLVADNWGDLEFSLRMHGIDMEEYLREEDLDEEDQAA